MCFYKISTVTVLILFQSAAILFFKFGSLWVSLELVGKVWWHQIGKQRWLLLVGLPERGESDGFRGLKTHSLKPGTNITDEASWCAAARVPERCVFQDFHLFFASCYQKNILGCMKKNYIHIHPAFQKFEGSPCNFLNWSQK